MPDRPPASSSPFDAAAQDYDRVFSYHQLGEWLRGTVHKELTNIFQPGHHILELGCGTGEDALRLARRGINVTATDASAEMLAIAREKCGLTDQYDRVQFHNWDFSNPRSLGSALQLEGPVPTFDGVFSNFGGLNCLPDRRALAQALHPWLKPGAKIALVLMGPICPWEIAWHMVHGQFKTAFRRFNSGAQAHVGAGQHIRTWYPSPARINIEFKGYRLQRTAGIGFLLPPSYLHHLVTRYRRFFTSVNRLERKIGSGFPWSWLADHYLMVFERQNDISNA